MYFKPYEIFKMRVSYWGEGERLNERGQKIRMTVMIEVEKWNAQTFYSELFVCRDIFHWFFFQ